MTDTEQQIQKLHDLIESSHQIFITSHISPDPDAVSSVLLLGTALKTNYPDKQIDMVLEEEPIDLNFLSGYDEIIFQPPYKAVMTRNPQLFILLDANAYNRASREDGQKIREYIQNNSIKSAFIDHHEPNGKDESDVYINQGSPAAVQDVYEILFEQLKLNKPEGYARTAMIGLYSDTGGFAYVNKRHSATLKLADELISEGASIEEAYNLFNQYSDSDIKVLAELAQNIEHTGDYTYSFIRDEFVAEWTESGKTGEELHKGIGEFVNKFIRNIGGRQWGFIVYRNTLQGDGIYSASFRSVGGIKDVAQIANKLGGGGHKPAAGAKFEAGSLEQAIEIVQKAIVEP